MRVFSFFMATVILSFLGSCGATKYSPDSLPDRQIHFGQGGGFTGAVTHYMLLDNGQIFVQKEEMEMSPLEAVKDVDRKKAKTLFKQAAELGLEQIEWDKPGNMYYFLGLNEGNMDHRITWGSTVSPELKAVVDYHKELMGLVKDNRERLTHVVAVDMVHQEWMMGK